MNQNPNENPFQDAELIFSYSRKQAIEDGVLIDLTTWASETGFKIPVACTATVWNEYVVPPEATKGMGQCERGRAHDLLWMLFVAIRRQRGASMDHLFYEVLFQQSVTRRELVRLKSICGPGDPPGCEPVITIMLPDED